MKLALYQNCKYLRIIKTSGQRKKTDRQSKLVEYEEFVSIFSAYWSIVFRSSWCFDSLCVHNNRPAAVFHYLDVFKDLSHYWTGCLEWCRTLLRNYSILYFNNTSSELFENHQILHHHIYNSLFYRHSNHSMYT